MGRMSRFDSLWGRDRDIGGKGGDRLASSAP